MFEPSAPETGRALPLRLRRVGTGDREAAHVSLAVTLPLSSVGHALCHLCGQPGPRTVDRAGLFPGTRLWLCLLAPVLWFLVVAAAGPLSLRSQAGTTSPVPGRTWQRHRPKKPPKPAGLPHLGLVVRSPGQRGAWLWCRAAAPGSVFPSAEPRQHCWAGRSPPISPIRSPPGVFSEQQSPPGRNTLQLRLQRLPGLHPAGGGPPRPDVAADVRLQAHSHAEPRRGGAGPLPVGAHG